MQKKTGSDVQASVLGSLVLTVDTWTQEKDLWMLAAAVYKGALARAAVLV